MTDNTKNYVEEKLKDLPQEQVAFYAWRSALRALPFLGANGNFNFWEEEERQRALFSVIFAYDIASAAACSCDASLSNAVTVAMNDVVASTVSTTASASASVANAATNAAAAASFFSSTSTFSATAAFSVAANAVNAAAFSSPSSVVEKISKMLFNDIDGVKNGGGELSTEIYGPIWENFQDALKNEGCAYWGKLFEQLFSDGDIKDKEAQKKRLNVPSEISQKGAAAVADYLEAMESKATTRLEDA